MKRFLSFVFFVYFFLMPNHIECNEIIGKQITLVDQLTIDYLRAEKDLWDVIKRREPTTLQQIYDLHTEFLNREYGEQNVLLNGKHVNNPQLIIQSVNTINETSQNIAREFFEHRNYTVLSMKAMNGVNLDETFEMIYNETIGSTDFWNSLKHVSYN